MRYDTFTDIANAMRTGDEPIDALPEAIVSVLERLYGSPEAALDDYDRDPFAFCTRVEEEL